MTVLEIKTAMASYLEKTLAELTVNGLDLGLLALNMVRRNAEMGHDFEFTRKLVDLSVNGVTGGSLSSAVVHGTATAANVKSIIDVGLYDDDGNLRPVEWTTVAESLERQRADNPYTVPRYPTDGWHQSGPIGRGRFDFSGTTAYRFPLDDDNDFTLGMEVYTIQDDWTGIQSVAVTGTTGVTAFNDTYYLNGQFGNRGIWMNIDPQDTSDFPVGAVLRMLFYEPSTWIMGIADDIGSLNSGNYATSATSTAATPAGLSLTGMGTVTGSPVVSAITEVSSATDIWTTYGSEYLLWAGIVQLNHLFRQYVPRQEGNIAPPKDMVQQALNAFKDWDHYRYEQNRRHGR